MYLDDPARRTKVRRHPGAISEIDRENRSLKVKHHFEEGQKCAKKSIEAVLADHDNRTTA
jgi:hypothetical protein